MTAALEPYRVIDLTEGGLNLAARLLADLGADVIRIEPPFGAATRCRGPYYHDDVHPERSLFWFAYNLNKRGITLDITSRDGAAILERLLATADILIDSCAGTLDRAGLNDRRLRSANPRLVRVAISPFGPRGPYADYRTTDLVTWALSGYLYACGDPERPPVRISVPVSEQIAGASGAAAAMHALWYRNRMGRGQRVDVSQLSSAVWANSMIHAYGVTGTELSRQGKYRAQGQLKFQELFRCKDGYVTCFLMQGGWGAPFNRRLVQWMREEGMAPPHLIDLDWDNWLPTTLVKDDDASLALAEAQVRAVEEPVAAFLLTRTKHEIFQRALRDSLQIGPVMDVKDISEWEHLDARDFWRPVHHPDIDAVLRYPGPFACLSETPIAYHRPAPRIGEHNREIYVDELGLSAASLRILQGSGAV